MPVFEIRLLGSPVVSWDGAPLPILRRQTRILLYRLAVPDQALSRDHLCFLFWPDVAESTAGRNLSHLLTHLRQALPNSDALITVDDRVYLDPELTWTDVGEFLRLRGFRGGRVDCDKLARAVQLYRGPFLDGVSSPHSPDYESWMMLERRTLERRYRDTLVALVEELSNTGQFDEAIRYAHRYLAVDRLDESIHQHLISLHIARGDRAAALQQYRQCVKLLEQELGVSPLPETRALYESALAGDTPRQNLHAPPAHWSTLPGPRVPLVGREQAWESLNHLYARASTGRGCVAMVTGEAGSGKSRLLEQFAMQSPARALAAAGQPGCQSLPFYLLIQAIRPQLRIDERSGQVLNDRLRNVSPAWLAEAAHLLPELGDDKRIAAYRPARALWNNGARPQLFECLSRFMQALTAGARPAMLCLDNLQWADTETLEWLTYFAPRLQDLPILALVAFRSGEDARIDSLRLSLLRQGLLTEIPLGGLTLPEVQDLMHHLLDDEQCDDRLATRVHDATGGNPFCVIQIVSALKESGLPSEGWADLDNLPAPHMLCAAVESRLAALNPVARQVAEACAILAPSFGFDLIRLTSGRRELETLDSLETLVARGLLDCHGSDYQFHQEIVRHVLEERMSPMRRQLLHRRAGRALEQLNRHAVEALARHYEAGDQPAKAAHFHELAAQRAEAMFAVREDDEHRLRQHALQPQ